MSYSTKAIDDKVVSLLQSGGVGFLPADTIYGLSCRALDQQAVERVYRLKRRDYDKPFIVLIANISQFQQLAIDESQAVPAAKYWPGPLTLICQSAAPQWLHRGTKSLAVRIPDSAGLRDLIARTGPLVSTSANVQDDKPASSVQEAMNYFDDQLDFYVDVGDLSNHLPSTLARNDNGQLEVIRPGAAKIESEGND